MFSSKAGVHEVMSHITGRLKLLLLLLLLWGDDYRTTTAVASDGRPQSLAPGRESTVCLDA